MAEKLSAGEALSVRDEGEEIEPGIFKLRRFVEDSDYCDPETESWIWSIGEREGEFYASYDGRYYLNNNYRCVFLR